MPDNDYDLIQNSEYDWFEVPGTDHLRIAVIPEMKRHAMHSDDGSRYREWTIRFSYGVLVDLLFGKTLELYGWYAESARETGTEIGNQLFTDSCIQHSELVVVIPNGVHLATLEGVLALGQCIDNVIITRHARINSVLLPIQINTFGDCILTGVQQYFDTIIVRMRIYTKNVVCTAFDQQGKPMGIGTYNVNFSHNSTSTSSGKSLVNSIAKSGPIRCELGPVF